MPYTNLGNILPSNSIASFYTHIYDNINHIHYFNGNGVLGFCRCLFNYDRNHHQIKVNNIHITEINHPELLKTNAWLYFIIEDTKMFLFQNSQIFDIPDGEMAPINDINIWCACAGINYAEIGTPDLNTLTNSPYINQLFNSENAFKYYQRSNELIKNSISLNNVTTEIESQKLYSTPTMLGPSTPNNYLASTSSGFTNSYGMWGGNSSAHTNYNGSLANKWCQLILPEPIWPYKLSGQLSTNRSDLISGMQITAKWQCSLNGEDWEDLDTIIYTVNGINNETQYWYNKSGINQKYKYFRIYFVNSTKNTYNDDNSSYFAKSGYFYIHGAL